MKAKRAALLSLFVLLLNLAAYNDIGATKRTRGGEDSIRFSTPANFPPTAYSFKDNPVTDAGFKLGRILFYDPILSKDRSVSCGSCHQQFAAFANLDHSVSHGVADCQGTRNAPPLFNLAWMKEFMWDGGVNHIEVSPLNALMNTCEMANELDTITNRLAKTPAYPALFRAAFGTEEINSQRLLRALAQFTSMLVSASSPYDKHVRGEAGGSFTPDQEAGYVLFRANCAACHTEPLFTDGSFRNNGLDLVSEDSGRDSITHQASDRGKFRVPSLRNAALTAPYMHDGRFETLADVLEHYHAQVKPHANLDPLLRKNGRSGIALSVLERKQVLAFLTTLTDTEFIGDERFKQP